MVDWPAPNAAGVWAVALSPDARRAITAGEDFTARVWDVLTGRCTASLAGHSGWVVDVAITADGTRCITASHDGTARCCKIPILEILPTVSDHACRNAMQCTAFACGA